MTVQMMADADYYASRQTAAKGGTNRDRALLLDAIDADCKAAKLDTRTVLAEVELRWLYDTIATYQES